MVRRSTERGSANYHWLQSLHTFSFGNYYDSNHMGFRTLRVINEDRVTGGAGFPTHPHQNMEIFSYVLSGHLEHKDSMGNRRTLAPGDIQLMSAGTGVTHSEYNPHPTEEAHFLQIWIQPRETGLMPSYTEWQPHAAQNESKKVLIISPHGAEGSAVIHQDASVYRISLSADESVDHILNDGYGLWLQIIEGSLTLNEIALSPGDGASTEKSGAYTIRADTPVEALLFEIA